MSRQKKEIIGDPIWINGHKLSLSRAVKAGDFIFLTGQIPMLDNRILTEGSIEEQTRACILNIQKTLAQADSTLDDVVKSMVWLKSRDDFPGFNSVYAEFFPDNPPARSALISDFLVDIRVEIECVAYAPKR
tara:strand:- start:597 stop:992 length:396 start_codon:yes stop_codon:yes gene_type:complete